MAISARHCQLYRRLFDGYDETAPEATDRAYGEQNLHGTSYHWTPLFRYFQRDGLFPLWPLAESNRQTSSSVRKIGSYGSPAVCPDLDSAAVVFEIDYRTPGTTT